ncbi:MAG TPA: hypothetical protein VES67_02520 [Vicinamibacterales bacterium]|nr:hypothetical protein [Vicinamibacterales bacterium]
MPVPVGTRIGSFEVTGVLGAGGTGACGHAPGVGPRRTKES